MYKVLHIMAGADAGGISTVVLNYYRHLNREKIHFDIALTTDVVGKNAQLLTEMGAEIFRIPLKSQDMKGYVSSIKHILESGGYQAIHVHENETSYVALKAAKEVGIKKRIAHSHTTAPSRSFKSEIKRLIGCELNFYYATNVVGCGIMAGERVFGKRHMRSAKASILPNAIEVDQFKFRSDIRANVRDELGLSDRLILGMVGRLSAQKNYAFALQVMSDYCKKNPDAILVIAGNGEDELKIQNMINELDLSENVRLLGRRNDISRLYMAFDIFLLPSLYEGFPVAAIEAVTAGLQVLLSDTITPELKFSTGISYLPISNTSAWVNALEQVRITDRQIGYREVKNNGFDLRDAAQLLEKLYVG